MSDARKADWLVDKCETLGRHAHRNQYYGERRSYHMHLEHTVAVMRRFSITDSAVLAAGWLHDAVEDGHLTIDHLSITLKAAFGESPEVLRVLQLVDAVTDGEGESRAERKARPYRLIPTVEGAILVKLADRIANVESTLADGRENLMAMYQKEQSVFENALCDWTTLNRPEALMWVYLRRLLRAS